MDRKFMIVAIVLLVILIGVGGVLIGRSLIGSGGDSNMASLLDQKTRELEDKNRQIQDLEKQAEQLRKEVEESAKQIAGLQDRVDQTNRGLASMQERLKTATRPSPASRETMASAPAGASADAGSYTVNRSTSVFEEASSGSRKITTIPKGTKVNVVRSVGDWLEVRSKHGNPPGYIRREDATYMGAN